MFKPDKHSVNIPLMGVFFLLFGEWGCCVIKKTCLNIIGDVLYYYFLLCSELTQISNKYSL